MLRAHDAQVGDQIEVVAAIAERRELKRHDREAEVEIRAELALRDHLFEVAVSRRDDADVDRDVGVRADRRDDVLLEHAQQLRLRRQRQVADLVEEDRAAVRALEPTARAPSSRR